jgi:predicted enzyme involved in methoxymalonyl-ACP biosynthesis
MANTLIGDLDNDLCQGSIGYQGIRSIELLQTFGGIVLENTGRQ